MLIRFFPTDQLPACGDLGAKVEDGCLLLPQVLAQPLSDLQIQTAEDLAGFLRAFPSGLAIPLGWEQEDLRRARDLLFDQLRPHLAASYLEGSNYKATYGVS